MRGAGGGSGLGDSGLGDSEAYSTGTGGLGGDSGTRGWSGPAGRSCQLQAGEQGGLPAASRGEVLVRAGGEVRVPYCTRTASFVFRDCFGSCGGLPADFANLPEVTKTFLFQYSEWSHSGDCKYLATVAFLSSKGGFSEQHGVPAPQYDITTCSSASDPGREASSLLCNLDLITFTMTSN